MTPDLKAGQMYRVTWTLGGLRAERSLRYHGPADGRDAHVFDDPHGGTQQIDTVSLRSAVPLDEQVALLDGAA